MRIRRTILIVDDHPIFRHGLAQLINQENDLEVCGEAEDYLRWTPLSRQKIDLIKDDGPASRWMIQLRSSDQSPFLQHPFVRGLF